MIQLLKLAWLHDLHQHRPATQPQGYLNKYDKEKQRSETAGP
jgi:hypothetical protein